MPHLLCFAPLDCLIKSLNEFVTKYNIRTEQASHAVGADAYQMARLVAPAVYRSLRPMTQRLQWVEPSVLRFKQQTFDCQLTVVPLPARLNDYCTDETGP